MRRLTILTLVAAFAAAFIGCSSTSNTNANNAAMNANKNSNVAVVVNNNSNMGTNTVSTTNSKWNANISKEEYEKDRAKYEADKGTSTIGQGASDSWVWFKTRSALATTADLRESTINVDVTNDVITLKGTVASDAEKKKAEEVAKGIDGQKGVKNELQVKANDSLTNHMVNGNTNTKMTNTNMKK